MPSEFSASEKTWDEVDSSPVVQVKISVVRSNRRLLIVSISPAAYLSCRVASQMSPQLEHNYVSLLSLSDFSVQQIQAFLKEIVGPNGTGEMADVS